MKSNSPGKGSGRTSSPLLKILILLLLGFLAVMGYVAFKLFDDSQKDQNYLKLLSDLRASSYRLVTLSRDATNGSKEAFASLNGVVTEMDDTWTKLSSREGQTQDLMSVEIGAFQQSWLDAKYNALTILENQETTLLLHNVGRELNSKLPELQAQNASIVEILLDNRAPADQVATAQEQVWRAERIGRNIDKMLRGADNASKAADQFNLDGNLFGKTLDAMKLGDSMRGISRITDAEALGSLNEIYGLFEFISVRVKDIFDASPVLFTSRKGASDIFDDSPVLLENINVLSQRLSELPSERRINSTLFIAAAAAALITLLFIGITLNRSTRESLKETAETNDRNQNAILRLLDELADLADGDLTTTATVTEDFTGAIADSINYTIDQLRVLVSRINETSERVALGARDTQQTALHLAEAAEHQAQEIAGASAAVNEMAVTIDQVSANAAESAGVAERSVSIAKNGSKVVQNTINGMDTIREQIQDTSKRIKRLGESSQEIGDIVSLINDIADQTNILALNAAIQASMAGDAGRGFAVVADEVQRLAERSATATKQIEALVKTIQNDTNEAVISMEQTTSEVVRGARLAQDAGVALEEIETVSASLAELIQNISNAARQQASSAGHISNTMNVIQEITSQTSAGTTATATAIGRLSDLAIELRGSVTDFKLPEEMMADDSEFNEATAADDSLFAQEDGDVEALEDDVPSLAEQYEEGSDYMSDFDDADEASVFEDDVVDLGVDDEITELSDIDDLGEAKKHQA